MKIRAKKHFIITGLCILGIVFFIAILNIKVSSHQGVNFVVHTIKMPLYIKIIEFFDRDYHYKELAKRIYNECNSDQNKVIALFEWTHQNIKQDIPRGWPIIDDHVWHIIVRGYGAIDQVSDVFTTLCNYAGLDAFFTWVYAKDRQERIPLSFVKIGRKWCVFDPFNGSYFKNKNGEIADVEELKFGSGWSIESLNGKSAIDYTVYFNNLPSVKNIGLRRANIQSPFNRLLFELKKLKDYFTMH